MASSSQRRICPCLFQNCNACCRRSCSECLAFLAITVRFLPDNPDGTADATCGGFPIAFAAAGLRRTMEWYLNSKVWQERVRSEAIDCAGNLLRFARKLPRNLQQETAFGACHRPAICSGQPIPIATCRHDSRAAFSKFSGGSEQVVRMLSGRILDGTRCRSPSVAWSRQKSVRVR